MDSRLSGDFQLFNFLRIWWIKISIFVLHSRCGNCPNYYTVFDFEVFSSSVKYSKSCLPFTSFQNIEK